MWNGASHWIIYQHADGTPSVVLLRLDPELLEAGVGVEVDHHGRLLAGVGVHLHLARHQHRAALVREDGELRARGELVPDQSAL